VGYGLLVIPDVSCSPEAAATTTPENPIPLPGLKIPIPSLEWDDIPGVPFQSHTKSELGSRCTKRVSGQC